MPEVKQSKLRTLNAILKALQEAFRNGDENHVRHCRSAFRRESERK